MSHHDQHNNDHGGHHLVPLKNYFLVWGALILGTIITVAVSYVDFGSLNMFIAMLVATVKASLVMMIFMGLKYEGPENTVTILLSFVFLGIFVGFTSSDVFWRKQIQPAAVEKMAASSGPIDVKKLSVSTPDAVAKGKTLFAQNCTTCHGAEGKGDGAASATLNPKPRNFTVADGWKNGRKLSGIFKTLTNGIKDSAMAAYQGISVEDRFALAHYIQSLGPKAEADTDADLAALGLSGGEKAKPEIPVSEAMERYADKKTPAGEHVAYAYQPGSVPRNEYCKLPAQYRPKWCKVNSTEPDAK